MNMFKPTDAMTPEEYIAKIDDPARKADIVALDALIRKLAPKHEPHIVVGMIGYGNYHYKSKSGREGDWPPISLASQKNYISLYISAIYKNEYLAESYKQKLPKANIGKSCVRFKRLSDLDIEVLEDLIVTATKLPGAGEVV